MERYGCHYMDVVDGQFSESERDSMSNGELRKQLESNSIRWKDVQAKGMKR